MFRYRSVRPKAQWWASTFILFSALNTSLYASSEIPDDTCSKSGIQPTRASSQFLAIGDGSIIADNFSGLQWQRCSVGQNWDDSNKRCTGDAELFNGFEIRSGNHLSAQDAGWRLPSIKEVVGIWESCNGTFNRQVFPSFGDRHWSGTSTTPTGGSYFTYASDLSFSPYGTGRSDLRARVRLVRSNPF